MASRGLPIWLVEKTASRDPGLTEVQSSRKPFGHSQTKKDRRQERECLGRKWSVI